MGADAPIGHDLRWPVVSLAEIATKIGSGATPKGGADAYLPSRARFALVRSQNVFDRRFDHDGLAFITDEQVDGLRGAILQPDDILLNITGDGITFGRACMVPKDVLPACVNQHVSIIRLDPQHADAGYVLAFLTHPDIKSYIESFNAGGSRRAVTKGHIESFRLPLPPLSEQRAIAHILGTLDDKIELNRRMNETLEAMARALFKSWFVEFDPVRAKAEGRLPAGRQATPPAARPGVWYVYALECSDRSIYIGHTEDIMRRFDEHVSGNGAEWTRRHPPQRIVYWEELPTRASAVAREKKLKTGSGREWLKAEIARRDLVENGLPQPPGLPKHIADLFPARLVDSELGEIPEGWEAVPLPRAIEINPTRSLRKGVVAPYLDMANMPTRGHSPDEVIDRPFGSGMRFMNGDTLVARITPCLENGKTAFVDFLEEAQVGWGSTEYIILRPKPPLPAEFAYCVARSDGFREFAVQSMTGSSGRQRVPAESLSHYLLATPPEQLAKPFGSFVRPLFARASAAARESLALAALRDTLLPKLISGELRVPATINTRPVSA